LASLAGDGLARPGPVLRQLPRLVALLRLGRQAPVGFLPASPRRGLFLRGRPLPPIRGHAGRGLAAPGSDPWHRLLPLHFPRRTAHGPGVLQEPPRSALLQLSDALPAPHVAWAARSRRLTIVTWLPVRLNVTQSMNVRMSTMPRPAGWSSR